MNKENLPFCIYLVRHGETSLNHAKRNRDKSDWWWLLPLYALQEIFPGYSAYLDPWRAPLNSTGERQAEETGTWLRERLHGSGPPICLTSPMPRALQTKELLGIKGQWEIEDGLRERHWGTLDRFSPFLRHGQWQQDISEPPGGESNADFLQRGRDVLRLFAEKLQNSNARDLVAVAHGEIITLLSAILLGRDADHRRYWAYIPPNGGVVMIRFADPAVLLQERSLAKTTLAFSAYSAIRPMFVSAFQAWVSTAGVEFIPPG